MARHGRDWLLAALLGASVWLGPSLLRADYIICWHPETFGVRVSCEPSCETGEWLWGRYEDEWLGCGTEGPDCGTSWGEWGHYTVVGPADPCPQGCWRTETVENDFRIRSDGAKQQRDRWQCQGARAEAE